MMRDERVNEKALKKGGTSIRLSFSLSLILNSISRKSKNFLIIEKSEKSYQ